VGLWSEITWGNVMVARVKQTGDFAGIGVEEAHACLFAMRALDDSFTRILTERTLFL